MNAPYISLVEIILFLAMASIVAWSLSAFVYYLNNPKLTQMQVFLHMIGVG